MFGDLLGTIEGVSHSVNQDPQAIAIVLEWADLDARLGYRSAGRWSPETLGELLNSVDGRLLRLASAIENIPAHIQVVFSLPTLPLPPLFPAPDWQDSTAELAIREKLASFALRIAQRSRTGLVNSGRLAEESPLATRYDAKSDLLTGFPYKVPHADVLTAALTQLLAPAPPKKGIITDLDDTLWSGIVGELGPAGVSWEFDRHHHLHALYQTVLMSLSEQGVLIGVASKNDPRVVEETFKRADLLLRADRIFPIEVHWNAKSGSIRNILNSWNITADSVIFIDDSPMELAEVQAAHADIHCIQFPKHDYPAGIAMFRQLQNLCGKTHISDEDHLRVDSIRRAADFRKVAESGSVPDSFIEQAAATVTLDFSPHFDDGRVLELVNKTNQFNLNGIRRNSADWQAGCLQPDAMVCVVSYEDKFGPLGKIAVLRGRLKGSRFCLDTWVMSCRAFSRRIEHQCLRALFDRSNASEISFEFTPTPRNGPALEFFTKMLGYPPGSRFSLTRAQFEMKCPPLYQKVLMVNSSQLVWGPSNR